MMTQKLNNPFIVGDWIKRDQDFIGRSDLIRSYLALQRQNYWLIGARRMGKTSLLRYLQRQFQKRGQMLPLFWDVSGANNAYDLKLSFLDCLDSTHVDFEQRDIQIPSEKLENESLLEVLRWLIRESSRKALQIILLIDEAEALFKMAGHDPQFMQRFKAMVLNHPALHIILASNHGLAPFDGLNADHQIASLLQAFLPPDYLMPWTREEARQFMARCLNQSAEQDQIIRYTGCLPFLLQMVCFYYYDFGDLTQTFDHIHQRNILDLFFRDDFHQLQQENCELLAAIAAQEPIAVPTLTQLIQARSPQIESRLSALNWLGFVTQHDDKNYGLNNQFLRDWMHQHYLPSYQKSANYSRSRHYLPPRQQVVIELCDQPGKIILLENGNPVYENQLKLAPDLIAFDRSTSLDFNTMKRMGQHWFHHLFGVYKEPVIQNFFGQDDSDREFVLIENSLGFHYLPFEYLHNGQQFLALKHGLFRTKRKNYLDRVQQPLFDSPLKILLFASNTPPDISEVNNEILILKAQFERIARELQWELEITTIPSYQADYLTWMNLLQANQFHIIHFAGHCRRDERSADNMIYLREQAGDDHGRVRAVTAHELSSRLGNRLLLFYLNACHDARTVAIGPGQIFSHFADAILAAGVKAVIGNSTTVNDQLAAKFARDFYWHWFSCQLNLAKALQMTRLQWSQTTRFQESGHLFWLAPVLWTN